MKHIYLILTLLITGCGTKSSDTIDSNTLSSIMTTNLKEDNFNEFFENFNKDSLFQITRIDFPFVARYLDLNDDKIKTEKILLKDWRHLNLEYKSENAIRQFGAYEQEKYVYTDSANIYLKGIDNGINVEYKFQNIKGQWFLVSKEDMSN